MMIAHSFRGELFGPAQRLDGATYVIDVEFRRPDLGSDGVVVDLGRARAALDALLSALDLRKLDEEPAFSAQDTTEYRAKVVFERMAARIKSGALGPGGEGIRSLRVTPHESHVAWASCEAELG